jgi:hypothetical protein
MLDHAAVFFDAAMIAAALTATVALDTCLTRERNSEKPL